MTASNQTFKVHGQTALEAPTVTPDHPILCRSFVSLQVAYKLLTFNMVNLVFSHILKIGFFALRQIMK